MRILSAVASGELQVVSSLLENFPQEVLQQQNTWVSSLLETTLHFEKLEMFKLLVEKFRVDINFKFPGSFEVPESVLFKAVRNDSTLVEGLVNLGADINMVNESSSPLIEACSHGNHNMVKLLLDRGARVDLQAIDGTFPLLAASGRKNEGKLEIVMSLLEHGADINARSKYGETALHRAAADGNIEVVQTLLERGAEISPDETGFTPLFTAIEWDNKEIVNLLYNSDSVSKEDKVKALEFMGASQAPGDLNAAYHYLRRAMEKRYEDPFNILHKPVREPVAAFGNVRESQTLDELDAKRNDQFALIMECLVLQDRLVGRGKMCQLDNFSDIWTFLYDKGHFETAASLLWHGIEFLSIEEAIYLLAYMLEIPLHPPSPVNPQLPAMETGLWCSLRILQRCHENNDESMPHHRQLQELCTKFLYACFQLDFTAEKKRAGERARSLREAEPMCLPEYPSALHAATFLLLSQADDFGLPEYKSIVSVLLSSGADINERDCERGTALAYILLLGSSMPNQKEVVEFLLEKGASPAYLRNDAKVAINYTDDEDILKLLQRYYPLRLQHLAAFGAVNNNVEYEEKLDDKMVTFVRGHE